MTSSPIRLSRAAMSLPFFIRARAFLAFAVPALAFPAIALGAPAAPVNSGKGKYTKQETQVQATQTNLTKARGSATAQEGDGTGTDGGSVRSGPPGEDSADHRRPDQQDEAVDHGDARRRSAEARLLLPSRRVVRREAALLLQPSPWPGPEDFRRAGWTEERTATAAAGFPEVRGAVAPTGCQGLHSIDQIQEIRADGRSPVQARLSCSRR